MNKMRAKTLLGATALSLATVSMVHAGGLERGGYNIDLLFDPAQVTGDVSATYVMPQRKLKNVNDTNAVDGNLGAAPFNLPSNDVSDTTSYIVPRVGFKASVGQSVDCMADYSQPWGAHSNPGLWAGANNNIETKITSNNYAGTCSYKMDMGKGQMRFIGGVFYQELSGFKERLVSPLVPAFGGTGRVDLEGSGWGWRAGVAYEIPDIALRASLVYNSQVKLDNISGALDLTNVGSGVIPIYGAEAAMPDSVELKLQSGIAPGWLAFGSIKWVDWSQLQSIAICPVGTPSALCTPTGLGRITSLDLMYRDGWTITAGVGHKFNDQWSGAAQISWDRGTSQGFGTQTDTWAFGGGLSYTPTENIEWRVGGAIGVLTSGHSGVVVGKDGYVAGSDVSYDFDNDLVTALSTSLKVKF
ncbi:long-chain fatty acid transporter [Mesorhizobium sp. Root157]|uniref:OmpP1/FadL family transporter n=1 Tax=Mesorhizobium sp. Root157 TaxID=1736477 RepID=UPI000700FFC7|nr:OmpP1/FadL family transporter [Mesorhizobium sp. Root157]KQZ98448.1 long-chain fatty acid transporter [Mesorhizobium sp. Root157]